MQEFPSLRVVFLDDYGILGSILGSPTCGRITHESSLA